LRLNEPFMLNGHLIKRRITVTVMAELGEI